MTCCHPCLAWGRGPQGPPTLWFPATHLSCQLWWPCHGPSHIFQEMQGKPLVGPGLCVHVSLLDRTLLLPALTFWQCSGIAWLAGGDLRGSFVGGEHTSFPPFSK